MKVSDPVLKLVIPYEQSNQGITNYLFHDIMFLCTLGRHKQMQSSGHIISRIRCTRFKMNSCMNYHKRDRNYPNILIFRDAYP